MHVGSGKLVYVHITKHGTIVRFLLDTPFFQVLIAHSLVTCTRALIGISVFVVIQCLNKKLFCAGAQAPVLETSQCSRLLF